MEAYHVSYHYPVLPKALIGLLICVDCACYYLSVIAFHLGLNPSFDATSFSWSDPGSLPTDIKLRRLPVVEYACRGEEAAACAVCLFDLEGGDEVRELGNCRHVFHKGCIDGWVDRGKLTCPVCRSALLPAEGWKSVVVGFVERFWRSVC